MTGRSTHKVNPNEPVIYQIRLKGHLGRQWTDWFEGLTITLEAEGDTLLTGPVVDQAALHGLLKKVRDLGLPLISVSPSEPNFRPYERKERMNTYRKSAVTVGILFLVCTAATILSFPFTGPLLESKDYLSKLFENNQPVITGALIEFIWAAAGAGIAIGLYPVLKRYNGALALGSVVFRVVENVFVLIGTLGLLSLLTLSREFIAAGAPDASSFQTLGTLFLALRDWQLHVISGLAFALGALMYYVVLYQSKLIPRWLSGWGVLAAVLSLAANVLASFTQDFGMESVHTYLNMPIGVNELVFAVWLIVKGFNRDAIQKLGEAH